MRSYQERIKKAQSEVEELSVEEANNLLHQPDMTVELIDIRSKGLIALGHIRDAVPIPAEELEKVVRHLFPDKNRPLLLYGSSGHHSLLAALSLKEMGYSDVKSMAGGIAGWMDAGYEIVSETGFTSVQLNHYSRQMTLSEVGVEGQMLLLKSRVLVVGAGGLGSSAVQYLAASGVGTLGVVDFDRVNASNLNRQVIHSFDNIGRRKTESAKEGIRRINPDVQVLTFDERLTSANALDIIKEFDVVLDGSDNFETKYLLNDAAFFADKPYVFGGAVRTEGQASVFYPKTRGPCLRCIMPLPPQPHQGPD
jgi:molybdopterin/thiamine biosynthesis adenylyltransferase/rhodanese-related sulfurtransferase